jgi:hypothetical protein
MGSKLIILQKQKSRKNGNLEGIHGNEKAAGRARIKIKNKKYKNKVPMATKRRQGGFVSVRNLLLTPGCSRSWLRSAQVCQKRPYVEVKETY